MCEMPVGAGFLGENISTHGLDEHVLCIGDVLRIGGRARTGEPDALAVLEDRPAPEVDGASRFRRAAGITSWYYRVLEPGLIAAGDTIELLERPNPWLTLADYWDAVTAHRPDAVLLDRIAGAPGLAADKATARWRERAAMAARAAENRMTAMGRRVGAAGAAGTRRHHRRLRLD